jgi:DNA polymerase
MISQRLVVRENILACTACDLHLYAKAPVPFSGPSPSNVVVMAEAPGSTEDTEGRPLVGAAGTRLRKLMTIAGFNPDEVLMMNTVSCIPRDEAGGKGRAPKPVEVESCRPHLRAQLALAQPNWVILTGNVPLRVFRPEMRVGMARGRPFSLMRWGIRAKAIPVFHPSAVLRNPDWEPQLLKDLQAIHEWVEGGKGLLDILPATCYTCGRSDLWCVDDDGCVFCEDHLKTNISNKPLENV